jgi:uncharacterized protein (UPF0332 family)
VNDEQQKLLQKARRALRTAQVDLADGDPEAAASRAYYAMFYVAEAYLLGEGLAFSSHHAVRGAFGKHFTKTGRVPVEFHQSLLAAAELRRTADYRTVSVGEADAADVIASADSFIRLAEEQLNQ